MSTPKQEPKARRKLERVSTAKKKPERTIIFIPQRPGGPAIYEPKKLPQRKQYSKDKEHDREKQEFYNYLVHCIRAEFSVHMRDLYDIGEATPERRKELEDERDRNIYRLREFIDHQEDCFRCRYGKLLKEGR